MKHLLLVVFVGLFSTAGAQTLNELTPSETGYTFRMVPPYQAAHSDTITVIVDKQLIDILKLKALDLFTLSLTTNRKAVGTLKEQSSYRIGEKFKVFLVKDEIKYSWEYYGDNAYGAKKKSTIMVTFDKAGNFKAGTVL